MTSVPYMLSTSLSLSLTLVSLIFHDFSPTVTRGQAGRWEISSYKPWKNGSQ